MNTNTSSDPILDLVVDVLSRIEGKDVDCKDLSMAAIVRSGYFIGLSYKSEHTYVIRRSGSEFLEFYSRETGNLLETVQVPDTSESAAHTM